MSGIWSWFEPTTGVGPTVVPTVTDLLNAYWPVLIVAFVATLVTVPIYRALAIRFGIIDRPDGTRKIHRMPIAYLGGAAVFTGVLVALLFTLVMAGLSDPRDLTSGSFRGLVDYPPVTLAVIFGMIAIFATGLFDDIFHWDPRLKLCGQLVAAAALALTDFGTNAISGLLTPVVSMAGLDQFLHHGVTPDGSVRIWNFWTDSVTVSLASDTNPLATIEGVYYWIGTAFIAVIVLGASNSANLIDGLDGLLSGTVGIMATGFIAIGVMLAIVDAEESVEQRAVGLEIVEMFVDEDLDWNDPATRKLLDFDGDGRVDDRDLRAVVGDPEAGEDRVHARPSPALQEKLGITPGEDQVWAPSFRGKDRFLAQFDADTTHMVERKDDDGNPEEVVVRTFNLVQPKGIGARIAPPVNQDDLRIWVDIGRVLEERRDPLAGVRLVIAFALLGACLGFLPYNFNPAVIFLGDAGSLLMGFLCGVLILSLGSEGRTHYVIAGLIIFGLPIMDTLLAILRRKLTGMPMSQPDKNHIHHMALRSLGSVKKAVLALYALDAAFVLMGVGLAATVAIGGARFLLVYGVAIVVFGMVGTMATKAALRQRWMKQLQEVHGDEAASTGENTS